MRESYATGREAGKAGGTLGAMGSREVVLPWGVPGGLVAWVEAQAELEDIDPGQVVARALDRERRRVSDDAPPADSRVKRPGVRGAAAKLGAGMITATELAELAGVTPGVLKGITEAGALEPDQVVGELGKKGSAYGYQRDRCGAVAALAALRGVRGLGDEVLKPAGRFLAGFDPTVVFRPGNFLVVGHGVEPRVATADHLGALLVGSVTATASVVVHLGPAGDKLASAMRREAA